MESANIFFQLAPVCRSSLIAPAAETIGQAEIARSGRRAALRWQIPGDFQSQRNLERIGE
ncbi:MAG: hypothetical protein DME28_10545 [Verrucomicrobia bacterium]|nr:MAG: hypothetical protein DME28_10545 [Verrucomicrobiota bacterium]